MNQLKHLSMIMDGNGRWAAQRGRDRSEGHRQGARKALEIIRYVRQTGISTLSLFAFSQENRKRPCGEVELLMALLASSLHDNAQDFADAGIRLRIIGEREGLSPIVQRAIQAVEQRTAYNRDFHLLIAVNYSGQYDICQAVRGLHNAGADLSRLTQEQFQAALQTSGDPDPDLIIRMGGETRLSNFFLWQAAYSEIHFESKLWPDFSIGDVARHIAAFKRVERRFGQISGR